MTHESSNRRILWRFTRAIVRKLFKLKQLIAKVQKIAKETLCAAVGLIDKTRWL